MDYTECRSLIDCNKPKKVRGFMSRNGLMLFVILLQIMLLGLMLFVFLYFYEQIKDLESYCIDSDDIRNMFQEIKESIANRTVVGQ